MAPSGAGAAPAGSSAAGGLRALRLRETGVTTGGLKQLLQGGGGRGGTAAAHSLEVLDVSGCPRVGPEGFHLGNKVLVPIGVGWGVGRAMYAAGWPPLCLPRPAGGSWDPGLEPGCLPPWLLLWAGPSMHSAHLLRLTLRGTPAPTPPLPGRRARCACCAWRGACGCGVSPSTPPRHHWRRWTSRHAGASLKTSFYFAC